MKKVIIYTDVFRYGDWIVDNMNIIKHLLIYQLKKIGFSEVITLHEAGFCVKQFLFLNNNISSISEYNKLSKSEIDNLWIKLNTSNINKEACDYFCSFFKDCIAISYHSSSTINNMLSKGNITYLDTFESSYRFLQDTYFSIRTNNVEIEKTLINDYSISDNKLFIQANYLKAFFVRNKTTNFTINPNSALIICQTPLDIVLIKENGDIDNLLNYQSNIKNIANTYSTLYYKLHPKSPSKYNKLLKKYFKQFNNTIEIKDDMYELLANDNIILVAGINSSSLYEAKYFNKKVEFFGKPHFNYITQESTNNKKFDFVMLDSNKHLFDINFWNHILNNIKPTTTSTPIFENYNDLLRNVLKVSSSYNLSLYLRLQKLEKYLFINRVKKLIKSLKLFN